MYLFRYYPNIRQLKNISEDDFNPGMVGIAKLPKVLKVTKCPKAVDLSNQQKILELIQNQTLKESEVKAEISESKAIDGIEKYFDVHISCKIVTT